MFQRAFVIIATTGLLGTAAGCSSSAPTPADGADEASLAANAPIPTVHAARSSASGTQISYPMIAVACQAFTSRASTFDCDTRNAVRQGVLTFDASLSPLDQSILIRRAYLQLSWGATSDCGGAGVCRGAYGVIGDQCLALAQSAEFTGFGSFMGTETTRADAETSALDNCVGEVGVPGTPCTLVSLHEAGQADESSVCPIGSGL